MKLFSIFIDKSPVKVFISLALGVLAGFSYALLIPVLLTAINENDTKYPNTEGLQDTLLGFHVINYKMATLFFGICLFILITRTLSQVIFSRLGVEVTTSLRKKIYDKISDAHILSVEQTGATKLRTALTVDISRITKGAMLIPEILINAVTLISMFLYLYVLNEKVLWFVVKCIGLGALTYLPLVFLANKIFGESRHNLDNLHNAIQGLIRGAKELKINTEKRQNFRNNSLLANEHKVMALDKRGQTVIRIALNYGDMITFVAIGAIGFIFLNYHSISNQEIVAVIMVMFYIAGPVASLLYSLPELSISQVSLDRLTALCNDLIQESFDDEQTLSKDWSKLSFKEICFQYPHSTNSFKVGPLNATFRKGSVHFIIGGNGSGKSTLAKIITGHYRPTTGSMSIDTTSILKHNITSYRNKFSTVFTDYFLFESLLDKSDLFNEADIENLLDMMELKEKVTIKNGEFSTLSLSDGQRKRLALLVSYLEDKEIYLFDEWAADQDPEFKDVFYTVILQNLRKRNKLVIVISHDERYFSEADSLHVMLQGKLYPIDRQNIQTEYKNLFLKSSQ